MKRHPWKRELLKLAADLRKKEERTDWSSVVLTNLEQNVYWSFLMIRKLLESNPAYALTVTIVSYLPHEKEDGHLLLHRPREQGWELMFLCNEIIHSAFFGFNFWDDDTLRGFIFCSGRRTHLRYFISSAIFIELLETIGNSTVEENLCAPIKFTTERELPAKNSSRWGQR
jgi:hypothetical protein